MKIRFSNIIWGTFLLLAAAFLLFNQFDGFTNIGVGSFIVTVIAVLFNYILPFIIVLDLRTVQAADRENKRRYGTCGKRSLGKAIVNPGT